jgi:nicotinamide mononucleotide (NMN) deamidase PncC
MSIQTLLREIHAARTRIVLAVAGGGSRAISELLEVPGASETVLEAVVPYSEAAMTDWLGGPPEQSCSARTARAMAMAAFCRARRLDTGSAPLAGVACTAGLASDRPKRGPHRAHLAIQTATLTATQSLELAKGRRSRAQEEALVSRLVLNAVAEASGLTRRLELDLLRGEQIEETTTVGPQPWQDLLMGRVEKVRQGGPPDQADRPVEALFPGAFDPMHVGHRRMVKIAHQVLAAPVDLEISILNVDKPPLDYFEIRRRTDQFDPEQTVWLTRSAKFDEKSGLFPGATFIVGTDTLRRIADPRYYADDTDACQAALERIAGRGCRFLVFGRNTGDGALALSDLALPDTLASVAREVPLAEFREDVSSTQIRRSGRW